MKTQDFHKTANIYDSQENTEKKEKRKCHESDFFSLLKKKNKMRKKQNTFFSLSTLPTFHWKLTREMKNRYLARDFFSREFRNFRTFRFWGKKLKFNFSRFSDFREKLELPYFVNFRFWGKKLKFEIFRTFRFWKKAKALFFNMLNFREKLEFHIFGIFRF